MAHADPALGTTMLCAPAPARMPKATIDTETVGLYRITMAAAHIRVIYDGPAVQDGEMDVQQLASSLLALGKLIENVDALRTGETGRVRVRVQSDVKRGSFDVGISLHVLEGLIDSFQNWVGTSEGAGTLALLSLLGLSAKDFAVVGGRGLIQAVRWLKGRNVSSRTTLSDGNIEVVVEDGDSIVVHPAVAALVDEPSVRQPLERFTEPLREEGVEEIRFEDDAGTSVERISATEEAVFSAISGAEPTSSDTFTATFQIKRLFFDRGRKWRLSSGAQTITAEILDEAFWQRVDASQLSFAKDDYLVCRVRMDQWLSQVGLKTEYAIISVDQHIPSAKQPGLPGL